MTLSRPVPRELRAAGAGRWRIAAGRLHLDAVARRLLGEPRARQSLARWLARQAPAVVTALQQARDRQAPVALMLPHPGGTLLMQGDAEGGLIVPLPPPPAPDTTLAHELRTPLQAIAGFTQLARDELGDAPAARWLVPLASATQLLLRQVGDLLDLAQLARGELAAGPAQPLDLPALVARLGALGAGLRPDGAVALYAHVDPRCPARLRGDGARLEQVLLNLLANALKYTPRGRVVLAVKVLKAVQGGTAEGRSVRLRCSVADTGAGIAADALPRLGRPFERLHGTLGTRPPPAEGSGLGLALVQRLLALLGSELKLVSVDGGGTLAWFDLALAVGPASAAPTAAAAWGLYSDDRLFAASAATQWRAHGQALASPGEPVRRWIVDRQAAGAADFAAGRRARGDEVIEASAAPWPGHATLALLAGTLLAARTQLGNDGAAPLAGLRVLLLEDNALNQLVAAEALQRAGAQPVVAALGRDALARVAREHFDCALLDLQLPDGSGLEVARRLRASPAGAALPFALLSAALSAEDRRAAEALGALACLEKPVAPEALVALVARVRRVRPPAPRRPALQRLFGTTWPAQRAELADTADAARLQRGVHALRGSLAVLGDAEALALAREVEQGLADGRPAAELPLAALIAQADRVAALGR